MKNPQYQTSHPYQQSNVKIFEWSLGLRIFLISAEWFKPKSIWMFLTSLLSNSVTKCSFKLILHCISPYTNVHLLNVAAIFIHLKTKLFFAFLFFFIFKAWYLREKISLQEIAFLPSIFMIAMNRNSKSVCPAAWCNFHCSNPVLQLL